MLVVGTHTHTNSHTCTLTSDDNTGGRGSETGPTSGSEMSMRLECGSSADLMCMGLERENYAARTGEEMDRAKGYLS